VENHGRRGSLGPVFALAFSPDGSLLATTCWIERGVRIRSVTSTARDRVVEGNRFGTNGTAFSPEGLTLATADNDGMVRLWTVVTGWQRAALDGGVIAMRCVAFCSAGGWLMATSPNDGDLRTWNLAEIGPRSIPASGADWLILTDLLTRWILV
jgi:WD40 repeat protein